MCMQSPCIKCIIVCDVGWIIPREQLRGDAIVKWLDDGWNPKFLQCRITTCYGLRGHISIPKNDTLSDLLDGMFEGWGTEEDVV